MKLALGVDIGGTTIKLAFVDGESNIICKRLIPTNATAGYTKVVKDIAKAAEELKRSLPVDADLIGAGVGAPGPVDGSVLFQAVNLGWLEVPLAEAVAEAINVEAVLLNDANAAALGERWAVYLKHGTLSDNMIFITLGTGVGGGIIANGEVLNGSHACGGEIGHIPSGMQEGRRCGCGNNDCLETYASATGLLITAEKAFAEHGVDAPRTCEEFFMRISHGSTIAMGVLDQAVDVLARSLAGIMNTLDPQDVVVGGGLSAAGAPLFNRLQAKLDLYVFPRLRGKYELRRAQLENDAGVIGCAFEIFHRANSSKASHTCSSFSVDPSRLASGAADDVELDDTSSRP